MRIEVTPRHAYIVPGVPLPLTVTITNTGTVIGGYALRVLGADPGWVHLPQEQISLFPDESQNVSVLVTPPEGLPAGPRRLAIQVRELTEPYDSTIAELDLAVPEARSVRLRPDPLMVTAGKKASFGVIVENNGNTVVRAALDGSDPEGQAHFAFEPPTITLTPGERALVDMTVRAKRRFAGQPVVRQLGLYLDDAPENGFFETPEQPAPPPEDPKIRDEATALAQATFVQKPVISRGGISLFGLLGAITVFALVITFALSRLVGQSAADRDLALQIAAAQQSGGTGGSSSISGTVRLLTTGQAVPAVSVSVFSSDDTSVAVATTATANDGTYHVANLAKGTYKLSFRGAGFQQIWYPGAATDSDATPVQLDADTARAGVDVVVGGVPATLTGKVTGDDVSAATLYLEKPASTGGVSVASENAQPVNVNPPPDNGEAVVQSVPIASDGSFDLSDVPSPSVYDLVVVKAGYATATQRIDIGAGEKRSGLAIALVKGDGLISGTVNSPDGALGGVTITATAGQSTATTVSLSQGSTGGEGTFTLRGLPTPASFTVVASAPGYASQTQTVTLVAGQKLTGMSITLTKSAGELSGDITLLSTDKPAPGVSVTVTDGQLSVQTFSQSTGARPDDIGHWTVSGLPLPGTYTVTFARADLAAQTVSVSLDASGHVTPGSQGASVDAKGQIVLGMQSATAVVEGVVKRHTSAAADSTVRPVGEVTVTLTSGSSSYSVTTASVPADEKGRFRVENIPAGTWTVSVQGGGSSAISSIMTLHAGDVKEFSPVLAAPASISGTVLGSDAEVRAGWIVQVYRAADYPGTVAYTTKTDASGHYTVPEVDAPQSYVIAVRPSAGSAEAATKVVTVKPSQNVGVDPGTENDASFTNADPQ